MESWSGSVERKRGLEVAAVERERYSSSSSSAVERETVPQRSKVFTGRFSIMIPL